MKVVEHGNAAIEGDVDARIAKAADEM